MVCHSFQIEYCKSVQFGIIRNRKNNMDDIKHKWTNPHFDDFEKKSRCNMKYMMVKRINTN